MKRRNFLKKGSALAASPLLLSNMPVFAMQSLSSRLYQGLVESGRILVLIQLRGGNDGLNTLIPLDKYGNLLSARPEVILAEKDIISLGGNSGLHPKLNGIADLYGNKQVGILQSVGYPLPNQSHFRSTDIWETGSASTETLDTGWLGRYMDTAFPGFPEAYPNPEFTDPLAITLGSTVSNTCQGPIANMSMALRNLGQFTQLPLSSQYATGSTLFQKELEFIRLSVNQANQYFDVLQTAADKGQNRSNLYQAEGNTLSNQLKIVAQLISGGLKTPIYVVNLGGFDTHANQVDPQGDNTGGRHGILMDKLSRAVLAFQDDLEKINAADRVLTMTYSEFGRRIASNASFGTDHGTAAPVFLFGTQVNPIIHGVSPEIPSEVAPRDNLPMQFDFRSVYGSVLQDWMGISESEVRELIFEDYQHIPIIKNELTSSSPTLGQDLFHVYPNPSKGDISIRLDKTLTTNQGVAFELYNPEGRRIRRIEFPKGKLNGEGLSLNFPDLSPGNYHLRLLTESHQAYQVLSVVP